MSEKGTLSYSDKIANSRGEEFEKFCALHKICATGLDRRSIAAIIELIDCKVEPSSIVDMITELIALRDSNSV